MKLSGIHFLLSLTLVAVLLLAGGCAKIKPIWDEMGAKLKQSMSDSEEKKEKDVEAEEEDEDEDDFSSLKSTRKRYSCPQNDEYRLFIEKSELDPGEVSRDDEVKHMLQYALCAPSDSASIQGVLTRRVLFKGKEVFKDSGSETFKAGTWEITAEISVPEKAPVGKYTLETTIRHEKIFVKRNAIFFVKP